MNRKDISFLLPLLALIISDAVIQFLYVQGLFPYSGFYSWQWLNYLVLLVSTLIGWGLKGKNYRSLLFGAIAAPTLFFLVSNFLVWAGQQITYTKDINGLMACYAAALPFYKNSLIATLLFTPGILFLYNYMVRRKAQLTLA
jgi:hypothetical protein